MRLRLLLALALWGAAVGAAAPGPLTLGNAILTSSNGNTTVSAPGWALQGALRGVTPASSPSDCAAACVARPDCQWANYCPAQVGCTAGTISLQYQQCQLLGANGTAWPTGLHGADIDTTAVFTLTAHPETFPGFATLPAQGLDGADFECAGSIQPGACVLPSAFDAVAICVWLSECRAVTVYANGTDGRSAPLAVLKASALAPSNSFLAPSVYSVQQTEPYPLVALYLHPDEAEVVVPSDAELLAEAAFAAGTGGLAANSSEWLGCIIANTSLMAGTVVDVIDGVEAAQECCLLCRQTSGGACNVWNWCQQAGGCSYQIEDVVVQLQQFQCELRFQYLVAPKLGWPPALLSRGADVPFVSGSPLVTVGPPLPGYTRLLGSGLFGQRGYSCPGSLRPQFEECVRSSSLEGHAQYCDADPQCGSFVYKPAGVYNSVQGTAIYKPTANSSGVILTPSSVLYMKEEDQSSSLSAGAIAGISIGAAALLAVAAALLVWRVRRQRRRHAESDKDVEQFAAAYNHTSSTPGTASGPPSGPACGPASGAASGTISGPPSGSTSVPATELSKYSRQTSKLAFTSSKPPSTEEVAAGSGRGNGMALQPNTPAFGAGVRRTPPPPLAPSPFAAAALHAFGTQAAANGGSGASGTAGSGTSGTAAAAATTPSGDEAPMPELMQLIEQQDRAQQSSPSAMLDVGAQLLTLPSNLPPELTSWVIDPADIQLLTWPNGSLKELGSGASGRVLKAVYRGEVVAAKEIDLGRTLDAQRAFVQEALRMQQLRHPHVVAFFGVSLDGPRGIILLEYCDGRDLHSALQLQSSGGKGRAFGWYRRGRRVALDVAKALNYLHSMGVVHMDVKSSNVLLTASGAAKLGDVGLSRRQNRTYLSDVAAVGTFDWAAPEVLLNGMQCTAAVDLFSFGVLLYEIITGERPVRGRLRTPVVPDECPEGVKDLMLQCLSVDPDQRPTAQQAMQRLVQMQRTPSVPSLEGLSGG